jgi:phosphomevalonate kinase
VSVEEIRRLIEEMNLRVSKDYQKINIEQLSRELREAMQFERQTFQRIDELEKNGVEQDLANYARMICKNTAGREIVKIQENYFKKIDNEYLNSN